MLLHLVREHPMDLLMSAAVRKPLTELSYRIGEQLARLAKGAK
jgi:hypothetical protein